MKTCYVCFFLSLLIITGCENKSSTPPGVSEGGPNGPGNGPGQSQSMPAGAISAGQHFAVPPASWGTVETNFGVKSISIDHDAGKLRVDFFNVPTAERNSDSQVARFKKMIEPASSIQVDEISADGMPVMRVSGSGTRVTLDNNNQPSDRYEGEGLIGLVFAKPEAQLLVMVSGDADAVKAFAPELEAWVKTFHK